MRPQPETRAFESIWDDALSATKDLVVSKISIGILIQSVIITVCNTDIPLKYVHLRVYFLYAFG